MARERFLLSLFALELLLCPCALTNHCSPEWERVGKACYRLLKTEMTWYDADEMCRGLGGGLAVPDSKMEQDAIWGIVKQYCPAGNIEVWIGCHKEMGTWHCNEYDDKAGNFTYWSKGQPNEQGADQICARMNCENEGSWWDKSCDASYAAICETSLDTEVRSYCTVTDDNGRILSRCLTGHAIRELPFKSVIACGSACRDEPHCRSFNVRHASQGTGKKCQLNNETRQEAKQHEFEDEENCYYFDL